MVSVEYLAGFVDGEGYLALGRIARARSVEYPLRLVVYNTNADVIESIRTVWGGTISHSASRKPGWKDQYALIWTNAAAANLIERVAPYLHVKAEQAAALLEFHAHVKSFPRNRDSKGRLLPMPGEEQESREAVYQHLKTLNARGRATSEAGSPGNRTTDQGPSKRRPSAEYVAGFIDGEGSLMINRLRARGTSKMQHRARIAIGNTNRAILEEIRDVYGGILVKEYRAEAGWKHLHQLVWTGGMLERLLNEVGPHLLIKRKQVEVMRDFLQDMRRAPRVRQGPGGRGYATLPEDVVAYRESLCVRMKELNARGVPTNAAGQVSSGMNSEALEGNPRVPLEESVPP